jgi:predicted PurR-regulated permease PerM
MMTAGKPKLVGHECAEARPLSPEQTTTNGGEKASAGGLTPAWQFQEQKISYVVLGLLTSIAVLAAYVIYRPFLKAIFLALVLTIAFWPLHGWVGRLVRGATVRALITTAAVALLIMAPLMLISFKVVSEAARLYSSISQHVGGTWSGHFGWLAEVVERTAEHTGIPATQLKSTIAAKVQELGSWLVGIGGWAVKNFVQQVGAGILTLLIMFFLLRDRDKFTRNFMQTLPLPPGRVLELAATLHATVVSNVYGMVAVGMIQGTLTCLGWWMTGLPSAPLWGAIATILSFVPLVGPSLVWIPGVLILTAQGRWTQAAVLLVWGAVVVTGADYLVRPRFASGRSNANTLLVLLSLLGGLKVFGAIGIIAGPVVLSAVTALLSMFREERQRTPRGSNQEQAAA